DVRDLRAAFFLVGPGVPPGRALGLSDMRDVAPTLARRVGLPLPTGDGKILLPWPQEAHMHYGVVMFATEYAIAPDELARALEERGFESVWFPEHTHIPASRRSPWPGGGDLPREYWS